MTLEDLKKQDLLQTRSIAEACKDSPETLEYIISCLARFFSGDYGEIGEEDTAYNNQDLQEGEGHILARYKARHALEALEAAGASDEMKAEVLKTIHEARKGAGL